VTFTIGRRAAQVRDDDDVVAELLACHARIRDVTAVAARLGAAVSPPADEVAAAAARVHRYFAEALPRHVDDEEQSLLPRLRGRGLALDAALAAMHGEHREHAPLLSSLLATCASLMTTPDRHAALTASLAEIAAALAAAFDLHLAAEERDVFPAVAALPLDVRRAIRAEMRARRG
jgi:iron-sulfur cluster repair protein YtfE (RIC family)